MARTRLYLAPVLAATGHLGHGISIVTSLGFVIPWSLEFEVAERLEAFPGRSACYGRLTLTWWEHLDQPGAEVRFERDM